MPGCARVRQACPRPFTPLFTPTQTSSAIAAHSLNARRPTNGKPWRTSMRCDCALSASSPAVNGVALGCAGLATVAATCADLGLVPIRAAGCAALGDAGRRVRIHRQNHHRAARVLAELLRHPRRCPGLGAFSMCLMFVASVGRRRPGRRIWARAALGGDRVGGRRGCVPLAAERALAAAARAHRIPGRRQPRPRPNRRVEGRHAARGARRCLLARLCECCGDHATRRVRLARSGQPANPGIWPLCAPWALLAAWHASDAGRSTPEAFGVGLSIFAILMLGLTTLLRRAARARHRANLLLSGVGQLHLPDVHVQRRHAAPRAPRVEPGAPGARRLPGRRRRDRRPHRPRAHDRAPAGVAAGSRAAVLGRRRRRWRRRWKQQRAGQRATARAPIRISAASCLSELGSPSDSPIPAASGAATGVEYV